MDKDIKVQADAAEDEPIPVTPGNSQSLLRPPAPHGVTFNKNLLMGVFAVVGTICAFALVSSFSPQNKEESATTEAMQPGREQGKLATANAALMPQDIAQLAESYGTNKPNSSPDPETKPLSDQEAFPGTAPNPFFDSTAKSNPATGNDAGNSTVSAASQEWETARKSGIRFEKLQKINQNGIANQATTQNDSAQGMAVTKNADLADGDGSGQNILKNQDQNRQADKVAYLQTNQSSAFYSSSQLQKARSKFEVKASTIIPAVLITGINSDLPGYISAQVRENVYDSTTGRYLLIPQGSRLVGLYDSKISYAQTRVMIIWNRLIFPNGSSLDLESIPGVDLSGYAGMTGKVNNHWRKLLTGVVISSLLSIGTSNATNDHNTRTESAREIAGADIAQNISEVGSRFVEKNLNVQPTIKVKPGAKFNVFVVKDFILQPYLD